MKKYIILLMLPLFFVLNACKEYPTPSEEENINNNNSELDNYVENKLFNNSKNIYGCSKHTAERLALNIVSGKVHEIQKSLYNDIDVWKIKIKTKKSAIVTIKINIDYGVIIEIIGDTNPYDYDIEFGSRYIRLLDAFNRAFKEINGEIEYWDIKFNNKHHWHFNLLVKTSSEIYKVKIKASNGQIISKSKFKEKGNDDEDDDDDVQ